MIAPRKKNGYLLLIFFWLSNLVFRIYKWMIGVQNHPDMFFFAIWCPKWTCQAGPSVPGCKAGAWSGMQSTGVGRRLHTHLSPTIGKGYWYSQFPTISTFLTQFPTFSTQNHNFTSFSCNFLKIFWYFPTFPPPSVVGILSDTILKICDFHDASWVLCTFLGSWVKEKGPKIWVFSATHYAHFLARNCKIRNFKQQ